jgi:ABC-2 type transport system permease protein
MEQLIATPVRAPELITGKLIPYWVIGMVDVALAVGLGMAVFGMPLRGNILLVAMSSALFLIGVLSQGILLSINLKTQVLASQIAIISTFLPTMFLSGFIYATMNMPLLHQIISHLVPARYFITSLRGVILKGVGAEVLWMQLALLVLYGVVMFLVANKRFHKRLAT